jgi:outer membrane protein assembly factor BamB
MDAPWEGPEVANGYTPSMECRCTSDRVRELPGAMVYPSNRSRGSGAYLLAFAIAFLFLTSSLVASHSQALSTAPVSGPPSSHSSLAFAPVGPAHRPTKSAHSATSPAASLPLVVGGDFPTYLGNVERTSSTSSEQLINLSTAPELHLLWKHNVGGAVMSQPVEQNGTIYFGSVTGDEYAVDATNGTLLWQTFLGQDANDSGCGDNLLGVTSTASAVGANLYVDGGFPYFYALNSSTGAVEWRALIGGSDTQGYYDWSSPLIYGGNAYVGISSDCDAPLVPAGVDEFSLSSHELVGYFNTSVPAEIGSSIWGSPSVNPATNTIYFTTGNALGTSRTTYDEAIVALNATTLAVQAEWQVPAGAVGADNDFGVTPTLFTPPGGYPMVTAANKNGVLYAFYQANLTLAWQQPVCCQEIQDDHISTAYGGGYVFAVGSATTIGGVSFNSSVTAFNPLTGSVVWQDGLSQSSFLGYAAPTWVNNVLIVPDQGALILLNANTGAVLYRDAVGGNIQAAASVARGEIFAGSSSGSVVAFDVTLGATAEQSTPAGPTPLLDDFNVTVSGGLPPYQYAWSFGDGTSSSLSNPSHTYAAPGAYLVNVSVTDVAGSTVLRHLDVTVGATPSYAVTFSETGLRSGTNWSLTFDGAYYASNNTNISLDEPNGTSPYTITSVPGYSEHPSAGSVILAGRNKSFAVSFLPLLPENYTVAYVASGLPTGANWSVTLNGSTQASSSDTILFREPNGTYPFSVERLAGLLMSPPSGTALVSGSNLSTPVEFSPTPDTVTLVETGLESGTSWSVDFAGQEYTSATPSFTLSRLNGTYTFTIVPVAGYTLSPKSGSVTVAGTNPTVRATFTPLYALTFTETGLPLGTPWTLQLGGVPHPATDPSIAFAELNGTYTYVVKPVAGYTLNPASGSVKLSGGPMEVSVTFRALYALTFAEHGLTSGSSWTVDVGGAPHVSAAPNITVLEPNGTLSYTVLPVGGYVMSVHFGSVVIDGKAQSVMVTASRLYSLTFTESGLPTGTNWTVKVGGVPHSSTGTTVTVDLVNGTYPFSLVTLNGYTETPRAGSAVVNGTNIDLSVSFVDRGSPGPDPHGDSTRSVRLRCEAA